MRGFMRKAWAIGLPLSMVAIFIATPATAVADGGIRGSIGKRVEQPLILGIEKPVDLDQLPKFHEVKSQVPVDSSKIKTVFIYSSVFPKSFTETLVEEDGESAATKKLIKKLPYKKTAAPEKLTLEQLEAIAKLPPRSNKAGMRVHPAMIPLFRNMGMLYNGGNYKNELIHFRLHTPDNFKKGKKYPMVVWLHGAGERGSDNINQLGHLHHIIPYLVGPKKRDFFLLVPQCPHTHCPWEAPQICSTKVRPDGTVECHTTNDPVALGNAPISYTLEMVNAVVKKYPVDTNRITIAGLSTGGRGTWNILERAPNLFAAAVPIVSWRAMSAKSLRENPILKKIPIWAIYSSDDRAIDYARKEFRRMKDSGCHAFKTEFGVCGHRAWTPAMLQGDIFGWLISRAKDGERFYAAEPSTTGPEKIGIFADVTVGDLVGRRPTRAPKKGTKAKKTKKPPKKVKPKKSQVSTGTWYRTGTILSVPISPSYSSSPRFYKLDCKAVEKLRLELISRYVRAGELSKACAVANKVRNRYNLIQTLLKLYDENKNRTKLLDCIDKAIDQLDPAGSTSYHPSAPSYRYSSQVYRKAVKKAKKTVTVTVPQPVPAGKKNPKDECGKEWAMSTSTLYGMFPSGWEKEADYIPDYVLSETGQQLARRLAKAFHKNDLDAMKELCNSFIKLDDIPLASPWFDTSGGRLKDRIKYTLNNKAKPVVLLLRYIARVGAKSKKEYVKLAKKALERIEKITHPKTDEKKDEAIEVQFHYSQRQAGNGTQ